MFKFRPILVLIVLCLFTLSSDGNPTRRQIRNLSAFANIYGYVRFFHPSDAASNLSWNHIAISGVKRMLVIQTDDEFVNELNLIFQNLGSGIKIFDSRKKLKFSVQDIIVPESEKLRQVSWQHLGFDLLGGTKSYSSVRLNRNPLIPEDNKYAIPLLEHNDVQHTYSRKFKFSISIKRSSSKILDVPLDFKFTNTNRNNQKLDSTTITATEISSEPRQLTFYGTLSKNTKKLSVDLILKDPYPLDISEPKIEFLQDQFVSEQTSKLVKDDSSTFKQKMILSISSTEPFVRSLFEKRLTLGDHVNKTLVKGIDAIVPLVLLSDSKSTYPIVDSVKFVNFINAIKQDPKYFSNDGGRFLELRLANVIITWNVLKHSFPYWQDASKSPKEVFVQAIKNSFENQSAKEFINTLKHMCAPLNDGHMFVDFYDGSHRHDTGTLPIYFTKIKNKIYVKRVIDSSLQHTISPGDQVKSINHVKPTTFLKRTENTLSGSVQWKTSKALTTFLKGNEKDSVMLRYSHNGKTVERKFGRVAGASEYQHGRSGFIDVKTGWIKPKIYYFDATKNSFNDDERLLFQRAKSIIIDLRGYPVDDKIFDLIPMLINSPKEIERFYVPRILWPDYEKITYDTLHHRLSPAKETIGAKLFVLMDATAQSASESFLGLIKDIKLGTIIGYPSSGTNGDINILLLPGKYRVCFTGMLVTNSDGTKHHINGVRPDVNIKETPRSLKYGRDEALQVAIDLASN